MPNNVTIGRFAPTPSGRLHLGNLFSFLVAYLVARQNSGQVLMRIEDLDTQRTKQEFADAIFRDLEALGFTWDNQPVYQSHRTEAYLEALHELEAQGRVYPCFCSRADLHSASAPHFGEEYVYMGTCRDLGPEERQHKAAKRNPATRVIVPDTSFQFTDAFQGKREYNLQVCSGDFIIRRSDGVFAYQLAVVVDDAMMGVNSVVRGVDLITSTPRQMFLQLALGYVTPKYGHVPLIVDENGKRLAKRDNSCDVGFQMREMGIAPEWMLGHLAYCAGLITCDEPATLDELVKHARLDALEGKQSFCVSPF